MGRTPVDKDYMESFLCSMPRKAPFVIRTVEMLEYGGGAVETRRPIFPGDLKYNKTTESYEITVMI